MLSCLSTRMFTFDHSSCLLPIDNRGHLYSACTFYTMLLSILCVLIIAQCPYDVLVSETDFHSPLRQRCNTLYEVSQRKRNQKRKYMDLDINLIIYGILFRNKVGFLD